MGQLHYLTKEESNMRREVGRLVMSKGTFDYGCHQSTLQGQSSVSGMVLRVLGNTIGCLRCPNSTVIQLGQIKNS